MLTLVVNAYTCIGEFAGEFELKALQNILLVRSRKPLSVVGRIEGSNPSPSAAACDPLLERRKARSLDRGS
jgi:hypothetical protein